MYKLALPLLAFLAFGGSALADDSAAIAPGAETVPPDPQTVECDDTRDACDDAMLAACPQGAKVLDENLRGRPVGAHTRKHYVVRFACTADAETAPLPAPDVAAVEDEPRAPIATEFAAPMTTRPRARPSPTPTQATDSRELARSELRHIDERLEELKKERARHDVAAPLVVTMLSLVGFVGFTSGAIINRNAARPDGDDAISGEKWSKHRRTGKVLIVGSVLTGATLAGALYWLGRATTARNKTTPEVLRLKRERRDLRRYDLAFNPAARELSFTARF